MHCIGMADYTRPIIVDKCVGNALLFYTRSLAHNVLFNYRVRDSNKRLVTIITDTSQIYFSWQR